MTNNVMGGKANIWSVVVLVISIMFFASGLIFGLMKESTARTLNEMRIEVKTNTARVTILERQAAVITNELLHINTKLDRIGSDIKDHMD
jgi:hypothetical protein